MMKILTVIGARPQFIKAATISKQFLKISNVQETIVHTGQHYDKNMSEIFFNELKLPQPSFKLTLNGRTHGQMTGEMVIKLEEILIGEKPDALLVYGDTNSTLAGALAASKLHIPIIHVEAGLRSGNMRMPEEINRIVTDRLSSYLYCPTVNSVKNLEIEGYRNQSAQIELTGDVMLDATLMFSKFAKQPREPINGNFALATIHRAENTDDVIKLTELIDTLNHINKNIIPVVIPLHPRTSEVIKKHNIKLTVNIMEPKSYFEMLWLLSNCDFVITDSGGLQKEAYFFEKPCITLREETEWIELVSSGVNILAGSHKEKIIKSVQKCMDVKFEIDPVLYGNGDASKKIVNSISKM